MLPHYAQLFVLFFLLPNAVRSKTYPIRCDAPPGWLLVDLLHEKLSNSPESLALQPSEHSELFTIRNTSIVSNAGLSGHCGQRLLLDVLATQEPYKRIVTVETLVQDRNATRFATDVYEATVDGRAAANTLFLPRIALASAAPADVYFRLISSVHDLFYLLNVREHGESFAKLYLSRRPFPLDTLKEFFVGAFDRRTQERLATAKVVVRIAQPERPPPVFENATYVTEKRRIQAHQTLFRVKARTSVGVPTYRIEPESVPFDVAPLRGDVFALQNLESGRYEFDVVAIDSRAQEGRAPVSIVVGASALAKFTKRPQSSSPALHYDRRWQSLNRQRQSDQRTVTGGGRSIRMVRRDRATDLLLALREDHTLGFLDSRIELGPEERIIGVPLVEKYLTVHPNGSIELTRPLNFEADSELKTIIVVEAPIRNK
ncbi:CRE-HMR-1 protein [Aphelenchoides avenae]|nr:CRE-HMR-1 protein [Aphelenchus avenae]